MIATSVPTAGAEMSGKKPDASGQRKDPITPLWHRFPTALPSFSQQDRVL
jgi:hypothetical protein